MGGRERPYLAYSKRKSMVKRKRGRKDKFWHSQIIIRPVDKKGNSAPLFQVQRKGVKICPKDGKRKKKGPIPRERPLWHCGKGKRLST